MSIARADDRCAVYQHVNQNDLSVGARAGPASALDLQSRPSSAPKVCMVTSRGFLRFAYQAAVFEAQDVLCQTADVDLVAPEPALGFPVRETLLRKLLWRDFSGRLALFNPGLKPLQLTKNYDLFIAYCPAIRDLLHINAIKNWRERCRTSVCVLNEIWAVGAHKCRHYLQSLKQFDHVIVGLEGSASVVAELVGRPCHFLPTAVDALRFSPYPMPPPRVIDVYSFGRCREAVHQELMRYTAQREMFYIYETLQGGTNIVRDYRQHRDLIATLAKRSRCIMVAPAKFDQPEDR